VGLNRDKSFSTAAAQALGTLAVPQLAREDAANRGCKPGGDEAGGYPQTLPSPARDYRKGASLWRRPAGNF